jgi:hypothetical protein
VKDIVDEVLQKLEDELIHDDKDYKLTIRQKENWIKYAITKEYPGGMPWEDQAENNKHQTIHVWLFSSTFIAQMNSDSQPY